MALPGSVRLQQFARTGTLARGLPSPAGKPPLSRCTTRCPVLTYAMLLRWYYATPGESEQLRHARYAVCGTDARYAATRALRDARYAMPGTDVGYAAMRVPGESAQSKLLFVAAIIYAHAAGGACR
eukprot:1564050-Rhodomonas_salina.1